MSEKKINVKLLREVGELILEEPRRLNMNHFAQSFDLSMLPTIDDADSEPKEEERPPCGTVMCIAGHAILAMERARRTSRQVLPQEVLGRIQRAGMGDAQRLLGLSDRQATRLFYFKGWMSDVDGWPKRYSNAYLAAKTPAGRARVTVRRIERFIKTNGAK